MDSADAQVALDSIESVRAAHASYAPTAQEHIRSVDRTMRQIAESVDAEISRRSAELERAQQALDACLASEERNCGAQAAAVARADERLRNARIARARIDVASAHYQPTARRFSSFVESSHRQAATYLLDRRAAIEQYAQRSGSYNAPVSKAGTTSSPGAPKSAPGIPDGFAMVPLDQIDDSDGSVTSPADFGKGYSSEDLRWGYDALERVVMPAIAIGRGMDYFRDRDARESLQGTRSYADTSSGFFGSDAIKLAVRPDGTYTVENGYHRIWVARQMGRTSVPARIR